MKELSQDYAQRLETIFEEFAADERYTKYLDEEEEEDYQALRDAYEPRIATLHEEIANENPLELLAFEKKLLNTDYEGLFLPRILGYAVLRGVVSDTYKYLRPQSHFRAILLAICNSSNFDWIKKRIGQTIQMGFSMSSDIWITNIINEITNKRVRYFLQGQKLPKYRDPRERQIGYVRYSSQFKNENFYSTDFPTTVSGLKVLYPDVESFTKIRISRGLDNTNILPDLMAFLENPEYIGSEEHLTMTGLIGAFLDLDESYHARVKTIFNRIRKENPNFEEDWLNFLLKTSNEKILTVNKESDSRISLMIDKSVDDNLTKYYNLMDIIHSKGYVHDETVEAVKVFYSQHPGLSDINECVRKTIFIYFETFIKGLSEDDYPSLFDLAKIFPSYIEIFSNQKFNQDVKNLCMKYIKRLLKRYTDKRGKDYQDIKKFVSTTFVDLNFLRDKEVVELFKTRRKRKTTAK